MTTGNDAGATPAANAGAGDPVDPGASAGAGDPGGVDGAGANGQPAAGSDGDPANGTGKPADGAAAGDGDAGDPADPAGDEPTGAPESYESFAVPEGMELEGEALSGFQEIAKGDNLTQAQAQKYVDLATGLVNRTLAGFQDQAVARTAQWAEQAKADPVVGGQNFDANVQVALSAVSKYGDPELKQAFEEMGLGNHPAIIRAFYRIGKAMGEGGFVHGQGSEQPGKPVNREQALVERMAAEQARAK